MKKKNRLRTKNVLDTNKRRSIKSCGKTLLFELLVCITGAIRLEIMAVIHLNRKDEISLEKT